MLSNVVRIAATSTKVLISGKLLGKLVTNTMRNEWMQRRKNKYQRDSRGYIIDDARSGDATTTHE